MIALGIPGLEDFLFRCAGNITELERKRRNTLLNEAVLIAADETIVIRFLVGLYLYTRQSGNRTHVVAQSGFAEPLDLEVFQRKEREVISILKSATMVPDTVGCAAKYWEPSKPFSSPVTERNTIERFGFVPESLIARAISISDASPEASSIAPL